MFYTNRSYLHENLWELQVVDRHTRDSRDDFILLQFSPLCLNIVFIYQHVTIKPVFSASFGASVLLGAIFLVGKLIIRYLHRRIHKNLRITHYTPQVFTFVVPHLFLPCTREELSWNILKSSWTKFYIYNYHQTLVERIISLLSSLPKEEIHWLMRIF